MTNSRRWNAIVAGAALGAAVSCAAQSRVDPLADAASAYEDGHYAQALALYERAADEGSVRAQEIAGLMRQFGRALYGEAVSEDRAKARAWFVRAARGGSEVGARMCGERVARGDAVEDDADAYAEFGMEPVAVRAR